MAYCRATGQHLHGMDARRLMAKRKGTSESTDLVVQALHAIRAEVVKTNERLDATNARLDTTIVSTAWSTG